jgi:hypothetical protein
MKDLSGKPVEQIKKINSQENLEEKQLVQI